MATKKKPAKRATPKKKKKTDAKTKPPDKTATKNTRAGVGAHGSRGRPKTGEGGAKWPGGGKKGEDE